MPLSLSAVLSQWLRNDLKKWRATREWEPDVMGLDQGPGSGRLAETWGGGVVKSGVSEKSEGCIDRAPPPPRTSGARVLSPPPRPSLVFIWEDAPIPT